MKSRMAGVLNLCFSIFKDFLLPAPFFRGLLEWDFGKIEEKSFTKLWALDCWFSRTNDQRLFCAQKGRWDWRYDMNEELTPQKGRFLREVGQKLLRRDLDARLLPDMDRRQEARAECVCAYARGMWGEAEGADRRDESGAGGVETAEGRQTLIEWTERSRPECSGRLHCVLADRLL